MTEGMESKDVWGRGGNATVTGQRDVKFLVSVSGRVKVGKTFSQG